MSEVSIESDAARHNHSDMDGRRKSLEDLSRNVESQQMNEEIDMNEDINSEEEQEQNAERGWTVVGTQKKAKINKIDICISSNDKLPKQFALAKMFKAEQISGINSVKYTNPFKVLVSFADETNAEKLLNCQEFLKLGWRIITPWEVNVSYGIIKDIDIGLTDSQLLESITCNRTEILSAKRLNRRDFESGWQESESVRLSFKGNSLPAFVYIHNLRIKVERYTFPVTQCSRCWRFGHTVKLCPSNKVICPKCGNHHANCETTSYNCVNCHGNHMALIRTCPIYLKEKKIRELMSHFNCSYRRALTIYIPPFSQSRNKQDSLNDRQINSSRHPGNLASGSPILSTTYASITVTKNTPKPNENNKNKAKKRKKRHVSNQATTNESSEFEVHSNIEGGATEPSAAPGVIGGVGDSTARTNRDSGQSGARRVDARSSNINNDNYSDNSDLYDAPRSKLRTKNIPFDQLLNKLSQVMFSSNDTWSVKIEKSFRMFTQWLISYVVTSFGDLSVFKKMLNFISNNV